VAAIFEARSIVVVGASATDPAKPGSRVLAYLNRHGYDGDVYAVHPTAAEIAGRPCFPSIETLPAGPLDLVCLTIPAAGCADLLDRCGKRGVKAAVVVTSGFAEAGADVAEQELGRIADRHGIALCGPNTIGVVGPWERLCVSFTGALDTDEPRAGGIAFVTQSGALGGSLLSQAWERGLGISRFASVGNQTGLAIADYLAYLAGDPRTRVACLVLESVADGPALLDALALMRRAGKPVVALKTGRSAVGQSAVRSHTGALAGDARVCDAVLREAGALTVATLTELVDAAAVLERQPLPRGPRVGIVSTSGGGCAVAADLCAEARLAVPALPESEREALARVLPTFAATQNPVDVTAQILVDPDAIARTLRIMLGSDSVDSVLVVLTTVPDPRAREIAELVVECSRDSGKPLVVAWTIARRLAEGGLSLLEREGVPLFPSIERAVAALAVITRHAEAR
jgi:acyl-CoA synthetase (NDP forming)